MDADGYNYARFDEYVADGRELAEFGAFPSVLRAGDRAPEIVGTLLDGRARLVLSESWRRQPVVVEFGSFT